MTIKKRNLLERLDAEGVLIAEGFLFEMEKRGYLTSGEFVPELVLKNPTALKNLHIDFQHAGSDIVEAFTYNGHREKMRIIGKEDLVESLNRNALKLAKEVAQNVPKDSEPNLVAGNISNTNIWHPTDKTAQNKVRKMFEEMIGWAVDEGVDLIIGETFYYAEEAYLALDLIKQSGLHSVVTISPMGQNIMRDNVGIVDCCKELEQRGADVVGMNCFRGPTTMMPYLKKIRKEVSCHVGALPIPYRTNEKQPTFFNLDDYSNCTCQSPHGRTFPTALDPLSTNRYEIKEFADEAYNLDIKYLGVCCGANPMLIREVAEAMGKNPPACRYREKMENHFIYGTNPKIKKHISEYGDKA